MRRCNRTKVFYYLQEYSKKCTFCPKRNKKVSDLSYKKVDAARIISVNWRYWDRDLFRNWKYCVSSTTNLWNDFMLNGFLTEYELKLTSIPLTKVSRRTNSFYWTRNSQDQRWPKSKVIISSISNIYYLGLRRKWVQIFC